MPDSLAAARVANLDETNASFGQAARQQQLFAEFLRLSFADAVEGGVELPCVHGAAYRLSDREGKTRFTCATDLFHFAGKHRNGGYSILISSKRASQKSN